MQGRAIWDNVSVLETMRPYVAGHASQASLDALVSFFKENADSSQNHFNTKTEMKQKEIVKKANNLRSYLLNDFLFYHRSPFVEGAVYDALLMLAKCFPLNKLNEQNEIISPLDSTILNEDYFVAANGYWFSRQEMEGLNSYYDDKLDPEKKNKPTFHYTSKNNTQFEFVARDFDRLKDSFTPHARKKRKFFSEDALPFAAMTSLLALVGGMLTLALLIAGGATLPFGGGILLLIGVGVIFGGNMLGHGLYYAVGSMMDSIKDSSDNKAGKADAEKDKDRDAAIAAEPCVLPVKVKAISVQGSEVVESSVSLSTEAALAKSHANNPVSTSEQQVTPSPIDMAPTVAMDATPSSGSSPGLKLFDKKAPPREPGVALATISNPNKTRKSL